MIDAVIYCDKYTANELNNSINIPCTIKCYNEYSIGSTFNIYSTDGFDDIQLIEINSSTTNSHECFDSVNLNCDPDDNSQYDEQCELYYSEQYNDYICDIRGICNDPYPVPTHPPTPSPTPQESWEFSFGTLIQ